MNDEKTVFQTAIKQYGTFAQTLMLLEEMSELQKEICKSWRGKDNREQIAEEIADVEIILAQVKMIYDVAEDAEKWRNAKVKRLWERLEGDA